MLQKFYQLRCVSCGVEVSEKDSVTRCPVCGEAIEVDIDSVILKKRVQKLFQKTAPISVQKYFAFYPLHSPQKTISLGEGGTPLIQLKKIGMELGQTSLFVKNEGQNPTGVFKDRGSFVEISKARELGANAVVCASTGNMAASVSAYAAVADLPCYVIIPEQTPLGKLSQALGYGARVLSVRGTYTDCCRLAEQMAVKYGFYLAGDYVFRGEGQKSLAFEVAEQLGWKAPDVLIVPIGCGTNLAAIWKGFVELKKLKLIRSLPKMVGVQPSGCSTIVAAFQRNLSKSPIIAHPHTICSAVGIGAPLDDVKALAALRESSGTVVSVADSKTIHAQLALGSKEAIFIEPSAALSLAAVKVLQRRKFLHPNDSVVLVSTGDGLKDPQSILNAHPKPPSVEPTMNEVDRFLKFKLYSIRSTKHGDKERLLFKKTPSTSKLDVVVQREFSVRLKESHLKEICSVIKIFLAKGKSVAKSDLQNLVENVLTDLTYEKRVMRVLNYELKILRKSPPQAQATVEFFGKRLQGKAKGVGPVDAVISAIRTAIADKSTLDERLIDFAVHVDADGTDATTRVSMQLRDSKKNRVIATASSPDIITASIEAFEKGYNILFWKGKKTKGKKS